MVRCNWLLGFLLLIIGTPAWAATYDLQTTFPNNCSANGGNHVVCTNLMLNWNDIINTAGPMTVTITGNVDFQNAKINEHLGHGVDFLVDGTVTSNQATIHGNLTAEGAVTLGYQTSVYGDVTGDEITTAANVTIDGSVSGSTLLFKSQNTINGTVYGTASITIESTGSVFNSSVISDGPIVLYSHTTINGNVSGWTITPPLVAGEYGGSNLIINGNINAVNEFVWPDKSQLYGNVTAGTVTILATQADITGTVTSYGDLIIKSGSGITGNAFSGGSITLESSQAYITGNATAASEIFIGWAGSIGGNATAPHIQNESGNQDPVGGEEYCDNSESFHNQNHAFSCTAGSGSGNGGGGGPSTGEYCDAIGELAGYGVIGDTNFTYGNNSSINGNPIVGDEGNTPTPTGNLDYVHLEYPPLDPEVFPQLLGGTSVTNPQNLAPGQYATVTVNGQVNSASTTAGTFYIQTLMFGNKGGNNPTLYLAPGDYFIGELIMTNNNYIHVRSTGQVRLFIRDKISGGNNIFLNADGDVNQLVVYLYDNARFTVGNYNQGHFEFNFNGLLYTPYENTTITFGNNSNIKGGIISKGTVNIGNNSAIDYSHQVQEQVLDAAGCTPLAPAVHHYRILHPTSTVACYGAAVNVKACADEQCLSTYDDAVTITVTSSAPTSQWQGGHRTGGANPAANLLFDQGAGYSGLRLIAGGTAALSLNNATPSALEPTLCFDSSGVIPTDCGIEFFPAGLLIVGDDESNIAPIPPQFAGSTTAFNTRLRAVRTNTTTGACEARLTGTQTVQLGVECLNPGQCLIGQEYHINGESIALNPAANVTQLTPLTVSFDATGTALLPANAYSDVGLLRLHAQIDLAEGAENPPAVPDPAMTLTGQSINDVVVKPYRLVAAAIDDEGNFVIASGAAPQPVFKAAGEPFSVVVQGQNSDGAVTPNFGNELPATTVTAGFAAMVFPQPAAADSNASKLVSGTFTPSGGNTVHYISHDNQWLEAGTFNLQAAAIDFLGAGDAFARPAIPTGRFMPAAFALDLTFSNVTDSCPAGGFTYMGEPAISLQYQLRALNTLGQVTKNYDTARYAQANADTATIKVIASSLTDVATDEFDQRVSMTAHQQWQDGTLTVIDSAAAFLRHPVPALIDGPYPQLRFGLQVESNGLDTIDWHADQVLFSSVQGNAAEIPGSIHAVYGRTLLEDVYGPDVENLAIVMRNEYFDGHDFITNIDDNCFAYDVANLNILADPAGLNATAGGASTGILVNGEVPAGTWWWQAPGAVGEFIFEYDTQPWLEFDWSNDSSLPLKDPSATAGFGQYRGNDRIIFWLERRN